MFDFVVNLVVDTVFSWVRILVALVLSVLLAWTAGILAAKNKTAERLLIPVFDILQGVPILGFLPIILVVFLTYLPAFLAFDFAVIFLVFSGVGWSMAFAVYEGVLAIPREILELAALEKMSLWRRIRTLYIPAAWPKVAYNTSVFWSAAVFYLISSEIFSLGSANYTVSHGIGVDLASLSPLSSPGLWSEYIVALAVLIIALALTRFLFLGEFALWSEKFKLVEEPRFVKNDPVYRFYSRISFEARSKLIAPLKKSTLHLPPIPKKLDQRKNLGRPLKFLTIAIALLVLAFATIRAVSYLLGVSLSLSTPALVTEEWDVLLALAYSFLRIWGIYGLAVMIGFPLGVFVGLNSRLYATVAPILQIVSSIPAPVFLPAAIFFVATLPFSGELTALFVIFLGMIWYIVFNVIGGVRAIPREIWEVVELSKIKRAKLWRHLLVPAALPSFITGSITAVGGGWSVLIVAEYFQTGGNGGQVITQVSTGIGKLLDLGAQTGDLTLMGLSLISMTALIVIIDRVVWRRLYRVAIARFSYNR